MIILDGSLLFWSPCSSSSVNNTTVQILTSSKVFMKKTQAVTKKTNFHLKVESVHIIYRVAQGSVAT